MAYVILVPIIALTAWVYASVGLGGGTAYLSIMSFWDSDPATLRPTAWSLNVVAASASFLSFYRQRHFDARLAWPFLVGGVIGASVGGGIQIDKRSFQAMLAVTLIAASLRMLWANNRPNRRASNRPPILPSLLLGAAMGGISGLVGIGGGIILGPVLIALGWADTKTLAAITSLYVLLNSGGAMISFLLTGGTIDMLPTGVFCGAVLAGAVLGARWGAGRASKRTLRRIFGVVALAAGVQLACAYFGLIGE